MKIIMNMAMKVNIIGKNKTILSKKNYVHFNKYTLVCLYACFYNNEQTTKKRDNEIFYPENMNRTA